MTASRPLDQTYKSENVELVQKGCCNLVKWALHTLPPASGILPSHSVCELPNRIHTWVQGCAVPSSYCNQHPAIPCDVKWVCMASSVGTFTSAHKKQQVSMTVFISQQVNPPLRSMLAGTFRMPRSTASLW